MGNKQGAGATRSTGITLYNNTPYTLYRDGYSLPHGMWTNYPPKEIEPYESEEWMTESDGFMTGTEGRVYYTVNRERFYVEWNNPFVGQNTYGKKVPSGGFTLTRSGGSGDNTYVTFKITAPERPVKTRDWSPGLTDYTVSKMKWYTKPIDKIIAGQAGAKHSWIWVKFDLNTQNKPASTKYVNHVISGNAKRSFEFIVERHKGGIYTSSATSQYKQSLFKSAASQYNETKDIDLRAFLIKCHQQNGSWTNRYHVKTKNCHLFAKTVWNMCATSYVYGVINEWLATLAGIVWSNSSEAPKSTGIANLNPEEKEEKDIFKRLEPYSK